MKDWLMEALRRRARRRIRAPLQKVVLTCAMAWLFGLIFVLNLPLAEHDPTQQMIRLDHFVAQPLAAASPLQRTQIFAFRSVLPSRGADGEGRWLSLNPREDAGRSGESLILDGLSHEPITIDSGRLHWRGDQIKGVLELGRFNDGLAAAQAWVVRADKRYDPRSAALWGYVDTRGTWVIEPRFAKAEEFNGPVAHVASYVDGGVRWSTIDRHGRVVSTDRVRQVLGEHILLGVEGGQQRLLHVASGRQLELPPGRIAADPSGALLAVTTASTRLFHSDRGEITLPPQARAGNILPLLPGVVRVWQERLGRRVPVLWSLAGTPHPLPPVLSDAQPWLGDVFLACTQGAVSTAPPYDPGSRCGVMDSQGRWRLSPAFAAFIRAGSGWLALGSGPGRLLDARGALLPVNRGAALPSLDPLSRQLGYRDEARRWTIPPRYAEASPFAGAMALTRTGRVPALINAAGQPHVAGEHGSLIGRAWQQQPAAQRGRHPRFGLIDSSGRMVLPFVFGELRDLRADGSTYTCVLDECTRMDVHGIPLAPEPTSIATQAPTQLEIAAPLAAGEAELQPAALNDLWGYVDNDGNWKIAAAFAAVTEFSHGRAMVAVRAPEAAGQLDRKSVV